MFLCWSISSIGEERQITAFIDDIRPTLSLSYGAEGVVSPRVWVNSSCSDNMHTNMRVLFGQIRQNCMKPQAQEIWAYIVVQYLPCLHQVSFVLSIYAQTRQKFTKESTGWNSWRTWMHQTSALTQFKLVMNNFSTQTTMSMGSNRSDVSFMYRIYQNGTSSEWFTNLSTVDLNLSTYNHSSALGLNRRSISLVRLSNTTLSQFYSLDKVEPEFFLTGNHSLVNGTNVGLSVSDDGVGFSYLKWTWDNGTVQQTSNLQNVVLPISSSNVMAAVRASTIWESKSWLNISVVRDCPSQCGL